MRTLRIIRLLAVLLLLLAALLTVAVAVLFTVDLSAYRTPLEARVSRELGRPVALEGPIRVEPSLTPTLTVRRVTIANAPWASRPLLAEAQRLSLQFRPWALLRGHIVIDRVTLSGARLYLETRADGTPNWMLAGLQPRAEVAAPTPPQGAPVAGTGPGVAPQETRPRGTVPASAPNPALRSLPRIEVRRTQVDYRDGRSGVVTHLTVERALLTAQDPRPLQLSFEGTLRGQPLALQVVGGPWSELVRGDAPWPLRLTLQTAHNEISAQGELERRPRPGFDLRLRAHGQAFAALARLTGVRVPALGPFKLQARLVRDAAGYEVSEARGFLGHADAAHRFTVRSGHIGAPFAGPVAVRVTGAFRGAPFNLRVDGAPYPELLRRGERWPLSAAVRIARTHLALEGTVQPRSGDFAFSVQADGALLSSLDPLLGRGLPALGPYTLRAHLLRTQGVLGAEGLDLRVGGSDVRGSLRLKLKGPRPALSGALEADTLNVADLRGLSALAAAGWSDADPPPGGPPSPAPREARAAGQAPATAQALPWSRRPLPVAWLPRLDAHLRVQVARVLGAGTSLEALRGTLRLHGGDLRAEDVSLRLAGEAITGHLALKGGGDVPAVELLARGQDLRYGSVLQALHLTGRLSGRAGRLEFSLRGQGRTPLAIWRSASLRLAAEDGDLAVARAVGKAPVQVAVNRLSASLGGGMGLELDAEGRYREAPFAVHLAGEGLPQLSNDVLPWHVRATGTLADASFNAVGSVGAPLAGRGVDLQVRLQGRRLASLGPVLGATLPDVGPYSLTGQLSDVPGGVRLRELSARVGGSDAAGELSYVAGPRPRIQGTLASRTLRWADFRASAPHGIAEPVAAKPATQSASAPPGRVVHANGRGGTARSSGAAQAPDGDRAIPEVRFPVQPLRAMALDLQLSAARVALPGTELTGVLAQVRLRHGRLEVRSFQATAWQGRLSGSLTLDADATPPRIAVDLLAKGVNYQRALGRLNAGGIEPATAQVVVRLEGRGAGLREVLADARGTVEFFGDAGRIDRRYLDLWASNMFLALLPRFGQSETAKLRCAAGRFNVKDGRAETRSLLLDVERIVIKGVGSVDLRDEQLDLLLWPEPRDSGLLRLTTPVKVTGTFSHPDVTPQARGVVEEVAWLLIGANNPFVLLLSYLTPNEVEDNPCVAALAAVESKGAQEENTPPTPISKTRDFFRGLGHFLERSFGGD